MFYLTEAWSSMLNTQPASSENKVINKLTKYISSDILQELENYFWL